MNNDLANKFFHLKNKIFNETRYINYLDMKYYITTKLALLRGYVSILLGRIRYVDDKRPVLIGSHMDFLMEYGSSIILNGKNEILQNMDISNKFYPSATNIGTKPHYNYLDPPASKITRIQLAKNSKLTMGTNTTILYGGYITIGPSVFVCIGNGTYISHDVRINARCGINFGENVLIGDGVRIMDYDGHPVFDSEENERGSSDTYAGNKKPINIQDDVWVGFGASILKGVTIGKGSIVAANACVTNNVPEYCIVAGNPAKIVKENIKWRRY